MAQFGSSSPFPSSQQEQIQAIREFDEQVFEGISCIVPPLLSSPIRAQVAELFKGVPGFFITLLRAYSVILPSVLYETIEVPDVTVEITSVGYAVYCEQMPMLIVTPHCFFAFLPYWNKLASKISIPLQERILEISMAKASGTVANLIQAAKERGMK